MRWNKASEIVLDEVSDPPTTISPDSACSSLKDSFLVSRLLFSLMRWEMISDWLSPDSGSVSKRSVKAPEIQLSKTSIGFGRRRSRSARYGRFPIWVEEDAILENTKKRRRDEWVEDLKLFAVNRREETRLTAMVMTIASWMSCRYRNGMK